MDKELVREKFEKHLASYPWCNTKKKVALTRRGNQFFAHCKKCKRLVAYWKPDLKQVTKFRRLRITEGNYYKYLEQTWEFPLK